MPNPSQFYHSKDCGAIKTPSLCTLKIAVQSKRFLRIIKCSIYFIIQKIAVQSKLYSRIPFFSHNFIIQKIAVQSKPDSNSQQQQQNFIIQKIAVQSKLFAGLSQPEALFYHSKDCGAIKTKLSNITIVEKEEAQILSFKRLWCNQNCGAGGTG